jgi:hypothetical protein
VDNAWIASEGNSVEAGPTELRVDAEIPRAISGDHSTLFNAYQAHVIPLSWPFARVPLTPPESSFGMRPFGEAQ